MGQDASQARVGVSGRLFVAPANTAGPVSTGAAWPAGYVDLGFADPAGPSLNPKPTIKDIFGWQSFYPLRTLKTDQVDEWKFKLLQTTGTNIKLAFGGGTITSVGGGDYRYDPLVPGVIDERAVGIEVVDGSMINRYFISRALVVALGAVTFKRDDITNYDITFKALQPTSGNVWTIVSNDAAMAV